MGYSHLCSARRRLNVFFSLPAVPTRLSKRVCYVTPRDLNADTVPLPRAGDATGAAGARSADSARDRQCIPVCFVRRAVVGRDGKLSRHRVHTPHGHVECGEETEHLSRPYGKTVWFDCFGGKKNSLTKHKRETGDDVEPPAVCQSIETTPCARPRATLHDGSQGRE